MFQFSLLAFFELYRKANESLQPFYEERSNLANKSSSEIKTLLAIKGIDVSKLKTDKQIFSAAKKNDIGIRGYDKRREDYIAKLSKVSPKFTKEFLDNYSTDKLKDMHKEYYQSLKKPEVLRYLTRDDLPATEGRLKQEYEQKGIAFPKKEFSNIKSDLKRRFPYLEPKEIEKETNKRLFAQVADIKTADKEIEKRYMEWQYGEPNRKPSYTDLVNLSKVPNWQFSSRIKGTKEKRIPIEDWRKYRDSLKDDLKQAQMRLKETEKERAEIQEESFIEQAIPEELR